MSIKWIKRELNIVGKCKQYRLSLWRCPQFLFLIMGLVIMSTSVITYTIGTRYIADPDTVSLIVFAITIVLFIITFSIVRSMEGLAEANRLKSEFISIVSHQLRSPLSNLKWSVEILSSELVGGLGPRQQEYMKIFNENLERMGELVVDLLMVSRIEEGRLPMNKVYFSFKDLAEEALKDVRSLADASNIKLNVDVPPSLPDAFADPQMIKLVLENILDNAVRYIRGKGEVFLKVRQKDSCLICEVRDTGVGIPKDDQKRIFEKFFRSQNALKYQTQGSGLSLHISKSIIDRSGGKIWFKSKEGEGTTFWFTLPTKEQKTNGRK